jgi:hypothetical protein
MEKVKEINYSARAGRNRARSDLRHRSEGASADRVVYALAS